MARIEVVIEELVLHGFAPAEGAAVGDAVRAELARLLAAQGLSMAAQDVEVARLNAGSFQLQPGAGPQAAGAGIARSLHTSLQGAVHD